ncbi:MAG: molecular chaperone HtpG [Lachnospiraceae bacterium]|nr:molecular chaperone HtpG [Lachnospiraceae bacterium]
MKQGTLSINSENIFPIIKKWLYSDHDIFFRELISNGCDAVTKLKKLELMGEFEAPEDNKYRVDVVVCPEDKIIKIIDNGIGMTGEEVEEYITQIAFSGAEAFLENYKDKTDGDQIIGHFGLGFYSAFMVAERVTIDTLSYKDGAQAVFWECDGGTEYQMGASDRTVRGTEITLYLNEDSFEFANEWRAREIINKYCSFMPVDIFFINEDTKEEEAKEDIPEVIDAEETDSADRTEDSTSAPTETPINDPHPLWTKHPNECSEEEYKAFYHKVFMDYKEPLFWIHLNMDYPFNLKGILYFPKITNQYESIEGTIKLYNNQVFIADNIKEVIPEFLLLLKGVIDCPDLPLNVSRSALQNDGFVKKISDYITKKVADKLSGMCKTDKESYEKYWDDISPFIKFGCLKDDKFNKKMNDYILFKNLESKYLTLPEYLEAGKEKYENKVFYVTDETIQSQYIQMFKEEGMDAVLMLHGIDAAFINHLEMKNEGVKFLRIDADLSDNFKENADEEELKETEETLSSLFKKVLNNDKLNIKVEKLKNTDTSSIITLSEEARRMQEMMEMYGMMGGMDPSMFGAAADSMTLVLNANNSLVQYVLANPEGEHTSLFCEQLFDLAFIANKPLAPEQMSKFIARSNKIMNLLAR